MQNTFSSKTDRQTDRQTNKQTHARTDGQEERSGGDFAYLLPIALQRVGEGGGGEGLVDENGLLRVLIPGGVGRVIYHLRRRVPVCLCVYLRYQNQTAC